MTRYISIILIGSILAAPGIEHNTASRPDHGYLRIADNHRYYVFDDGTSYVPVGFNHFRLWYQRSEQEIDSLLTLYAAHGITYLRIWVEVGGDLLEFPAGNFNTSQLERLDYIVQRAEDLGIYLTLCFFDENSVRKDQWWPSHAYNSINGGPATEKADLYGTENPAAWNALLKRYRLIVERYQDSKAIMMWDLVNDSQKTGPWKDGMYNFVRAVDSRQHIITFQLNTGKNPAGEMDCGSVRVYNYNPPGNDPEEMAKKLDQRIREALAGGDPVYVGEGRMDYSSTDSYALERGFLHLLWMPIASGAAGNTHWWVCPIGCKEWPELSARELVWMRGFSLVCKAVDWKNFNSVNANAEVRPVHSHVLAFACRDADEMLIYLMHDDPAHKFETVHTRINLATRLKPGAYEIEWIDIRTGDALSKRVVKTVPAVLPVPPFKDGIFARISRVEDQGESKQ